MAQKKNEVKTDAGEKYKDIELTDARIVLDNEGGLLKIVLKDTTNNFFIDSKDVNMAIAFTSGQEVEITSFVDKDETEIKKLKIVSVEKNKVFKIKLNKLLELHKLLDLNKLLVGVKISDRV